MPEAFDSFWKYAVDFVWGLPLVILISSASLYFFFVSGLKPFRAIKHSIEILLGRYDKEKAPGQISHFQALCSALSGTIGMGNIAGVAIAIATGGAGAIFWMWFAGLLGMMTKFFTCTLSCLFRKKDSKGIEQGGPMYFIEVGLGKRYKPLAMFFALCGMLGCIPMFQTNQLASLLEKQWQIPGWVSGLSLACIIGVVIIGGIERIGKITSRLVPLMFLSYLFMCLFVILGQIEKVPQILIHIFSHAFGTDAIVGGAMGLTFKEVLITGIKRAVFSNEAGVGTEALAHGAAKTREPVREGLVAMLGPLIDTHIVCTLTALVILISGVSQQESGVLMAAAAFEQVMPDLGRLLLLCIFSLFAISTMITYSYYSQKCAVYVLGEKMGNKYLYVYLMLILFAAIWQQMTIINIIDTMFALMVIPTLLSTFLLSHHVVHAMQEYFRKL